MKLLQITDTHVGRPGFVNYGVDPLARLDACVADINAHHSDAALCLVTGDLVNDGSAEEYANLTPVLRALKMPFRVMTGNHDDRANLRRFFPETPVDANGFYQGCIDVPGGRLLMLDTLRLGKASGELCERRLAWLSSALEAAEDSVYLFMHHPPMAVGVEYMDAIGLTNSEDFWKVVAPHRSRIKLIVFGHVHRPVSGVYRNIAFAGCPSTVHQVALELGPQQEFHLNFNHEPPCYAILDVTDEGCIVHQQRYLENWKLIPRQGKQKG